MMEVRFVPEIESEKILYLASVSGFCQGVERALRQFHEALSRYGAPVYVLYELVHNEHVTRRMSELGAIFVNSLDQVPAGSVLLLGAHGVSRDIEGQAQTSGFKAVIDSTCPFVRALHRRAAQVKPEEDLLLYGKAGHPEATGILGHSGTERQHVFSTLEEVDALPELVRPLLLVQTTMSHQKASGVVARLRQRFPQLRCPSGDVCHASQERQASLEALCQSCEGVLVIGSAHSSNANRLVEVARLHGRQSWLVEDATVIPRAALELNHLGLIGGASVPNELLRGVADALAERGYAVRQSKNE